MLISKAKKSRLVLEYARPFSVLNRSCNFTTKCKLRRLAFNFIDMCQLDPLKAVVVGTCGAECSISTWKEGRSRFFPPKKRERWVI